MNQIQTPRESFVMLDHIPSKHREPFSQWLKSRRNKGNSPQQSANLFDYVAWKSLYDKGLIQQQGELNSLAQLNVYEMCINKT